MSPADLPAVGTETRASLARSLMSMGLDKRQSTSAVRAIVEVICNALASGDDVALRGFGRFSVSAKGAGIARNPRTGEGLTLPPRAVVTFRPADGLRQRVSAALCSGSERSAP